MSEAQRPAPPRHTAGGVTRRGGFPFFGSLRFRLTAWYTGALALVLALAAAAVFLVARHTLRAETDGFLASEARRIAAVAIGQPGDPPDQGDLAAAVAAPGPGLPRRASDLLLFDVVYARLLALPHDRAVATSPALARQPALIASLNGLLASPPPAPGRFAFAGPDEERTMRVLTVPAHLGPGRGILQVAVPWDHNDDILERLGLLLALGVAVVLPPAALGGWVLVGRTLQPIDRIVAEAERLDAQALPEALLPQAAETDSEVGHLVATLNRMTTRLRHAFEAQRRFAADASHELRTPLTILRGEMELSLSRPRAPEVYQATLASAVEEIARMSRIVEGLSFLARRDAGRDEAGTLWQDVNLEALCQAVADEFAPMAHLKQIRLTTETCRVAGGVTVRGSADQLLQIVRNLVDNAVKYTPTGGCVTVTAGGEANGTSLTVEDTGIGIAPDDLPHVFDRFWRGDRSRTGSGSGLGLALCAEIAAAHGGRIEVSSEPGRGSRFRLWLPEATGKVKNP